MREQRVGEGRAWVTDDASRHRGSIKAIKRGETSGESGREGLHQVSMRGAGGAWRARK